MPTAPNAATKVVPNPLLAAAAETLRQSVTSGEPLSQALTQAGRFSPILVRFAAIGEQSGRLPDMLVHFADLTETTVELTIDRLMGLLAPMLTIAIGLFVGGLILSVPQTIMSVNELAVGA